MKSKILLMLVALVPLLSIAQQSSQTFNLQQCIDYALTNNTDVKNSTLDEYISKSQVQEYISTGLPQASASAGVQHANPLRRLFLQNNRDSPFGYNPDVPDGAVMAFPNFFQLKNSADASVTVTQLIFSNTFFVGLKASKTFALLSKQTTERTKIDVVEHVTKAYYMAVINAERKNLFDVNLSRVDSLLKQTRAMNKAGFAEKIDVDRLEVTYNNLITEKVNFENLEALSLLTLKYQMNMPLETDLLLSDNIQKIVLDTTISQAKVDFSNRIEYKMLQTNEKLDRLNLQRHQQSYFPTLSASGNWGTFNQSAKFDYLTTGHAFYPYATYSLGLNVPLFTGFGRVRRVQQAKFALQKTQNNIERFKSSVDIQSRGAEITYKNSLQGLKAQQRNIDLAKEVARVTRIKFTSGTGSNIEVVTAEASLKESQINYYNALYDVLVSRVDYDKALGNLK